CTLLTCTSPTERSTLPLHDALPICFILQTPQAPPGQFHRRRTDGNRILVQSRFRANLLPHINSPLKQSIQYSIGRPQFNSFQVRSEEHTSELQSRENLVCRLLLEKK